jgi:drug/metabolite transporter (DMT)-like permease
MDQRLPASAYAAAVGMMVAFALSFVATKTALRGFEPLLIALLRFTLAGGILWISSALWAVRRRRKARRPAQLCVGLLAFVRSATSDCRAGGRCRGYDLRYMRL